MVDLSSNMVVSDCFTMFHRRIHSSAGLDLAIRNGGALLGRVLKMDHMSDQDL